MDLENGANGAGRNGGSGSQHGGGSTAPNKIIEFKNIATALVKAGFNVIPVASDKRPLGFQRYAELYDRRVSLDEVSEAFRKGGRRVSGVALLGRINPDWPEKTLIIVDVDEPGRFPDEARRIVAEGNAWTWRTGVRCPIDGDKHGVECLGDKCRHGDHEFELGSAPRGEAYAVLVPSSCLGVEEGTKKLLDGAVELRIRGYQLLPPSKHPSGIRYDWVGDSPIVEDESGEYRVILPKELSCEEWGELLALLGHETTKEQEERGEEPGAPSRSDRRRLDEERMNELIKLLVEEYGVYRPGYRRRIINCLSAIFARAGIPLEDAVKFFERLMEIANDEERHKRGQRIYQVERVYQLVESGNVYPGLRACAKAIKQKCSRGELSGEPCIDPVKHCAEKEPVLVGAGSLDMCERGAQWRGCLCEFANALADQGLEWDKALAAATELLKHIYNIIGLRRIRRPLCVDVKIVNAIPIIRICNVGGKGIALVSGSLKRCINEETEKLIDMNVPEEEARQLARIRCLYRNVQVLNPVWIIRGESVQDSETGKFYYFLIIRSKNSTPVFLSGSMDEVFKFLDKYSIGRGWGAILSAIPKRRGVPVSGFIPSRGRIEVLDYWRLLNRPYRGEDWKDVAKSAWSRLGITSPEDIDVIALSIAQAFTYARNRLGLQNKVPILISSKTETVHAIVSMLYRHSAPIVSSRQDMYRVPLDKTTLPILLKANNSSIVIPDTMIGSAPVRSGIIIHITEAGIRVEGEYIGIRIMRDLDKHALKDLGRAFIGFVINNKEKVFNILQEQDFLTFARRLLREFLAEAGIEIPPINSVPEAVEPDLNRRLIQLVRNYTNSPVGPEELIAMIETNRLTGLGIEYRPQGIVIFPELAKALGTTVPDICREIGGRYTQAMKNGIKRKVCVVEPDKFYDWVGVSKAEIDSSENIKT